MDAHLLENVNLASHTQFIETLVLLNDTVLRDSHEDKPDVLLCVPVLDIFAVLPKLWVECATVTAQPNHLVVFHRCQSALAEEPLDVSVGHS